MKKLLLVSLCLLLLGTTQLFAQSRTITGTVIAKEDGGPIPGASVKLKGSNLGVQTNADGKFSINVPESSSKILVFSFVSYATIEKAIGAGNVVNVTLTISSKQLGEVVVTGALGLSKQVKALGYSQGTVKPEQILQKSEPDMLRSLEGKVAGVDIAGSMGVPGSATRITIRGNSSFYGNNEPLFIVDGVPYSNDQTTTTSQLSGGGAYGSGIANLDPNDIASMQILKGSAGAALYGSRASNGVIVITTKSGSAGRSKKGMEISFRSSVSEETIASLPDFQNQYGAGSEGNYSNSNGSWGPAFSATPTAANGLINTGGVTSIPTWPTYQAAYPALFPNATIPYVAYPNNVKDLFQTGYVFENSISINGGDEKNAVAATASQLNNSGYIANSTYERTNFSLGGSTKLNNGVNMHANVSYSRSVQEGGFFGENQVAGVPSEFARTLFLARNWDLNLPYQDPQGNSLTPNGGGQFDNPRWSAQYNTQTTAEERIIADFRADKDLTKWANLSFALGTNVNTLGRREVTEIGSRAASGLGSLVVDNLRTAEIESNTILSFTPKISSDFTIKPLIGINFNQQDATRIAETGNIFIVKGIHELGNTSQQIFDIDNISRHRIIGVYGQADLGYKDYLFLTLTGRNDNSSTLPVSARSYWYYSANGSFVFSQALKIENDIFDYGKIRAGYSRVGADAAPYQDNNVFVVGTNFLGQSTGSASSQANNPILTPEFTTELELGTQLSFFKKRLGLDFTFYNKNSTSQLASLPVAPSTGYTSYYTNFGSLNNRGEEVELTLNPIRSKDFNWNISANFSHNKNIVTSLTAGVTRTPESGILTTISPYFEPGMPYGYLRGTVNYRDANGNFIINPTTGALIESPNQAYLGDPEPQYRTSMTNKFTYKGFTLDFQFDLTKGGSIFSETINTELGRGVTTDTQDRNTSWVIPGVYGNTTTGAPLLDANGHEIPNTTRISTNDLYFASGGSSETFGINGASEWSVYDATVYRLREATLTYAFPKSMYRNLPIGSISLSLSGHNLWYFAPGMPKGSNFDPETNSFGASNTQGIELSSAPTVKRYGVNLSVTF